MKALVFGVDGRLGRALVDVLRDRLAFGAKRADADVTDAQAVEAVVASVRPDVVFNATAYNSVDAAESNVSLALNVNGAGPRHIAQAARRTGALVVHVSTNFVFDGLKVGSYDETDTPAPRTVYGISKWMGERLVETSGADHILVRTSAVFGSGGSGGKPVSFVGRVVDAARRGEEVTIVDDQVVSATYAKDLARVVVSLVERAGRGVFHVTNAGATTWHNLAQTAIRLAGLSTVVRPITTAALGARAPRPPNSPLSSLRLSELGIRPLRPWEDALKEYLAE